MKTGRVTLLKIERVETFIVELPTIRPHVLSMATMRVQSIVIVRLYCSDGILGYGEATTIGGLSYGEESPEGIKLTIETYLEPLLRTTDPSLPAATMRLLGQAVVGNHFAKAAIEMALLDAQGKRVGLPISELLGGRQRDTLPVAWTLASGDTDQDIEEAERMLASRRHNIFKIKIGKRALDSDIDHVVNIKRALEARASVRVDVNQSWTENDAAMGISRLQDAGIDLIEQPIAAWNKRGMKRLAASFALPIMADEMLRGPQTAFDLAAYACADVFAVKVAQSGGLYAAAKVAAIGESAGLGLYGGTMLEGAIGTAASAHLCATFSSLEWGTELFGPLLLTEELLAEPLVYKDFSLVVPTGPGLGITLDEERLEFLRRDSSREPFVAMGRA
jgi:muconate cycloisomerase